LVFIYSQDFPNEFYENKIHNDYYDLGKNWNKRSSFSTIRFQDIKDYKIIDDSLNIYMRFGLYNKNESIALYGFSRFVYQKNFYGYLYSRIVNNPNQFERYTGIPRDITRVGLNSGETDLSGIGYQNKWFFAQIGRGRESWGASNDINITLNQNSPSYDYIMFGSDYGKIRVKYIHSFLETVDNGVNRFLVGKGIEYSNNSSILFSISEIVTYSGFNRPLDFGYLNPISTHLEVELNDRLNINGEGSANGLWQLSSDMIFSNKFRVSTNLTWDELIFDKEENIKGKENGTAQAIRISYNLVADSFKNINIVFKYIKVGTSTFRHRLGANNLIQRGKPIGWKYGSDGYEYNFGVRIFNFKNLISSLYIGNRYVGEESILNRPYEPYSDHNIGKFPRGEVDKTNFIAVDITFWSKKTFSSNLNLEFSKLNNGKVLSSYNIGFNMYIPLKFRI